MVNAYWMMVRYCMLCRIKVPFTHYKFQEQIGYALLDPENEWPRMMKEAHARMKRKSNSTSEVKQTSIRPRLTETTLSPTKGKLSHRRHHELRHYPHRDGKSSEWVCQLHRQANRAVNNSVKIPKGARSDVWECRACRVRLCIGCWELYHTHERFEDSDYEAILARD
jgi:hypothetical protein